MHIQLIQQYGASTPVATRLAQAYGGRAFDVLQLAEDLKIEKKLLLPEFAILEAEVYFAIRNDWCIHPQDFLCRRSRLAFVNKQAALRALPRVVEIMAAELKWTKAQTAQEMKICVEYFEQFGGPISLSPAPTSDSSNDKP